MIRMVSEKSKKQDHHWTPSRLQNSSCSIKHRPQFNLHKTSKLCKSLQRCYTHTPTPTVSHTHINGFISRQIHQSELETRLSRTKLDSTPLNTLYAWTSVLRVFQIQTPPKWIRICYKSIKICPKINGNPQKCFLATSLNLHNLLSSYFFWQHERNFTDEHLVWTNVWLALPFLRVSKQNCIVSKATESTALNTARIILYPISVISHKINKQTSNRIH